jgi:cation diffusion facilitator family transporter
MTVGPDEHRSAQSDPRSHERTEPPTRRGDHPHDHDHVDDHDHPHPHDHEHGDHNHAHRGGLIGVVQGIFAPHSHDASDKFDDALEASREGMRALKISLFVLALTAVFQVVIVWISGSVALLADTVHNFSDALTAVPIGVAFMIGRRRPTRRYTYGYGRAEDIAGLFVLATMLASALVALYEAINRLIHPRDLDHLWWVAVAGFVGFLGNEWVALYRIRVGRRIGSGALIADGLHARTDGLTSLAVLFGAVGVGLGWDLADPIVGLAISAAIFAVLRQAAKEVFGRMMDRVDENVVDTAEDTARGVAGVVAVDRVRARWVGHELVADISVQIDPNAGVVHANRIAGRVRDALIARIGRLSDVTVEVTPASGPVST